MPSLKIRLLRTFSLSMWIFIAKDRQGEAQLALTQSNHPQTGLFGTVPLHIFFSESLRSSVAVALKRN